MRTVRKFAVGFLVFVAAPLACWLAIGAVAWGVVR